MAALIDTSGLIAVVDAGDALHGPAARAWEALLQSGEPLVSTNYLLVEAYGVLQRRFGMGLVDAVSSRYEPLLHVHWVDEGTHRAGLAAFLAMNRRRVSLVDCVSFQVMRRLGLTRAFTLDPHFVEQGFEVIPEVQLGSASPQP
ncbi:MAG: PIN domain-containing protein [Armatimonadetes bacterium]|nr:PIN domain-containing protein [Armatimonadota bacterium]